MITRFNYTPVKERDSSHDDVFSEFSYEKRIIPISKNEDGSIDKYSEECFWKEKKSSWAEYSKSFDLGSVQDQVMSHLEKGTPLITAHTLPAADYTKLEKGARIKREMAEKGISIDMIISAVYDQLNSQGKEQEQEQVEGGAQ